MVTCAVLRCSNRSGRDPVRFFSMPHVSKNATPFSARRLMRRRALWISRLNRPELFNESICSKKRVSVCSRHFISGAPAANGDEENPDWAPSLHLGMDEPAIGMLYSSSDLSDPKRDPLQPSAGVSGESPHYQCSTIGDGTLSVTVKDSKTVDQPLDAMELCTVELDSSKKCINERKDIPTYTLASTSKSEVSGDTDESAEAKVEISLKTVSLLAKASVDKETELSLLEQRFDKVSRSHAALKTEVADLKKSFTKVRNQLTESECDKLDLINELTRVRELCEKYEQEVESFKFKTELALNTCIDKDNTIVLLSEQLKICKAEILDWQRKQLKPMQSSMQLVDLESNDKLVHFYTGLKTYENFEAVLSRVKDHVTESSNFALAPWQCLLLTLMRLRLALTLTDLGYRFGVSDSTACRTFDRWLQYLYTCLDSEISWPDRDTLWLNMPLSFQDALGKSVAIIIDCFEIFTAKPGSVNTKDMICICKYLISITPCGTISFVSNAWEGNASNYHIAHNCELYDKLMQNDVIIADSGFIISEDHDFYCARLVNLSNGQVQLSAHEAALTSKIKSLRMHIKKVIGIVKKKFHILQNSLPIELVTKKAGHDVSQIDQIVRVCCALTNIARNISDDD